MIVKEKILSELFDALNQETLIREQLIEVKCKEYLRFLGYKIIEPIEPKYTNVKNTKDLVQLFYALVDYHYPQAVGYYRNIKKDMKIAKDFVQSRMDASSITKKEALQECSLIIETLFKNSSEFNFDGPVSNFGIFGQQKMGWVTEKIIRIIHDKNKEQQRCLDERIEKEILDKILKEKGVEFLRLEGI